MKYETMYLLKRLYQGNQQIQEKKKNMLIKYKLTILMRYTYIVTLPFVKQTKLNDYLQTSRSMFESLIKPGTNLKRKSFDEVMDCLNLYKENTYLDYDSEEYWRNFLLFLRKNNKVEMLSYLHQMGADKSDLFLDLFEKSDAEECTQGKGKDALLWLAAKAVNRSNISLTKYLQEGKGTHVLRWAFKAVTSVLPLWLTAKIENRGNIRLTNGLMVNKDLMKALPLLCKVVDASKKYSY